MSRNVIVIGGVALGPKAASRLKRLDPTANVTMIDENINISFGGCGIPYYVSGEINSLDALRSTTYGTVRTPEYFEHKGVHTLNQTRVTAIDRAAKTVTAKNLVTGEEKALPYDRLIIATGSTPKVPPVEGRDLKNVGGANNLEDADALRKACASGSVQNAVVIGAGFIGMEIAVALADMWDIKTSVVEFMPQAMPGVMSASLSDMVRHDLEEHNVDVYTGEKVQRLEGENGVVARVVTDKRTLDADLVIFATGFAPNTALARAAGLDLEERTGAILVNEYMQTSDPDIYAGGDCVAIPNLITGKPFVLALGSLANRQGRVIGTNLAGGDATFPGYVGTWCVKLFDKSFAGVGLTGETAVKADYDAIAVSVSQFDRAHFYPEKKMMQLELVVDKKDGRVLGMQGCCEDPESIKARVDAVAAVLQNKPFVKVEDISNLEVCYAPPFASAMDVVNAVGNVAENVLAGRIRPITPEEFLRLWHDRKNNNFYFIDSRPQKAGEAEQAKHPDWHALSLEAIQTRWNEVPKDRPIAIICNTGLRSYDALLVLARHGITDVVQSMGGMQAVHELGASLDD